MAAASLLLGLLEQTALVVMRWLTVPFAIGAAGYTAALFAQCEGRDLWQGGMRLFLHLLVQAVFLGSATLLPWAGELAFPVAAAAPLQEPG